MNTLKGILKDLIRLWPLLVIIAAGFFLFSGVGFMVALNRLSMFALILLVFHLIRKSLFPYIDLKRFTNKAAENPMSAAIVFAVIIFFIISLCYISVVSAMTNDQILQQAKPTLPIFKNVVTQYWSDAPKQQYFPGTVEQETCASLKKCWNFKTELKTSKEYGFGLSQITIAYTHKGNVRFNNFLEAKKKYHELSQWQWDDRFNPKYQLTYIVLQLKHLYQPMKHYFKDDDNRWAASLVSYNAGPGKVIDRMTVCDLTKGCDKTAWFNGLDSVVPPSEKKKLYGKALYLRINEYPENVIHVRASKYIPYWGSVMVQQIPQSISTAAAKVVTAVTTPATTPATTPPNATDTTTTITTTPFDNWLACSKQLISYLKESLLNNFANFQFLK